MPKGEEIQSATLTKETTSSTELVGTTIKYSGNIITKSLYLFQCIHGTSLGPEILAATFPDGVEYMVQYENMDCFMHHIGMFIVVGILVANWRSAAAWSLCLIVASFYYIHVYYVLLHFFIPLRTAAKVSLIVPLDSNEGVNDMANCFVEVTKEERTRFTCTTDQNTLLGVAMDLSQKLTFMVYNKGWNFRNINYAGNMNVFSHCTTLIFVILSSTSYVGMVSAAVWTYLLYYFTYWCMLNRGNVCIRGIASNIFNCVFLCGGCVCCGGGKTNETDLVETLQKSRDPETGKLPSIDSVTYIKNNCFNGYI